MPFNLSALAGKLIGIAVLVAIVGGILLAQHLKINAQARVIAEQRVQVLTLKVANDHFSATLDAVTRDLAEFEKRAAVAEAKAAEAKASVIAKTETIVRRIIAHATPQDNQPVTPALGDALRSVRGQ